MSEEKFRTEEFHVNGEELLGRIKKLVHEGNIRRIIIKNKEGGTVIEIPLTFGVVGALLAPTWLRSERLPRCLLRRRLWSKNRKEINDLVLRGKAKAYCWSVK